MTVHPALGITAVLATLGAIAAAIKFADRWLSPELSRKLMHVGTGAVVLTFPWLFTRQWPVVLLSALSTASLVALRSVPRFRDGVGTVLHRVGRPSLGEVYFSVAVALVFWMSARDPILYCVPILILTLADAVAALIGVAYGRVRYVTSDGLKSAEGSLAFFSIAFLSVHVPLLLYTDVGRAETLLIAAIIGLLATLIEAAAWRGLDNLLIPLGTFAFLKLYLDKSTPELAVRLLATVALLVFVMAWRRRTRLDDGALMGGALFAYGALMLGGPAWLVGPIALFLAHALLWPAEPGGRRGDSVFALLSVIATALLWLALHVRDGGPSCAAAYATTFGAQLAIVGVSRIGLYLAPARQVHRLARWIGIGIGFSLVQWLLIRAAASWSLTKTFADLGATSAAVTVGTVAGATLFFLARPIIYGPRHSDAIVQWTGFAAGLIGSAVAFAVRLLLARS